MVCYMFSITVIISHGKLQGRGSRIRSRTRGSTLQKVRRVRHSDLVERDVPDNKMSADSHLEEGSIALLSHSFLP